MVHVHGFTTCPRGAEVQPPHLQAVPFVLQAGAKKVLITAPAKVRPDPLHASSCRHPHWRVFVGPQMHSSLLLLPASTLCMLCQGLPAVKSKPTLLLQFLSLCGSAGW